MALSKIEHAVTDAARKEADAILAEARAEAESKVAAERETAQRQAERRYEAGVRAIDDDVARKLLQAKGAASKHLLEDRNAVLGRVFALAREAILAAPASEYEAVMKRYLERAAAGTGGRLRVHPQDKDVFQRIVTGLNAGRAPGLQVSMDNANPLSQRGGFILVTDSFEVDQTIDAVVSDIEHELAPAIAAELFAGSSVG